MTELIKKYLDDDGEFITKLKQDLFSELRTATFLQ